MASPADRAERDLDALRRRVYAPDATDADRAAYRAATAPAAEDAAPQPEPVAAPVVVESPTPRRRNRLGAGLLAGGVAVLLLVAVLISVLPRAVAGPPPPSPTPIAVDGPTRTEFLRSLTDSGPAGIAAYLVTHRSPPDLRRATRFFTIERWGTGPRTFTLRTTDPRTVRGRATVFLVLDRFGSATWTAYELRPTTDSSERLVPQASRSGQQRAGVPTVATYAYTTGRRPASVRIDVLKGVRWGAAVVFSD